LIFMLVISLRKVGGGGLGVFGNTTPTLPT
jgi:hypothetical protein